MKKIFLLVPIVALLAAGCGSPSTQSTNNSSNQGAQEQSSAPALPANSNPSQAIAPSTAWQATLLTSDNTANGKYMIITGGHKIYLKTNRDYNALVGKSVNVTYSGSLTSFTLNDIIAQ